MDAIRVGDLVRYAGSLRDSWGLYVVRAVGDVDGEVRFVLDSPTHGDILRGVRASSVELVLPSLLLARAYVESLPVAATIQRVPLHDDESCECAYCMSEAEWEDSLGGWSADADDALAFWRMAQGIRD